MSGKKTNAEMESVANEPGVQDLFSGPERVEMRMRAKFWKESPEELITWLEDTVFFQIQILAKLASGEKALPGRTGQNIFYRALGEFNELASEIVKIARGRLAKEVKK